MAGYKIDRVSESILRELTAILRTIKDPRVTPYMLSVVRVEVSNDMAYATVYISAMEGLKAAENAVKGLVSAQGYIRRELGRALKLRQLPELRFVADDSMEYSINIAKKLSEIERNSKKDE
ncbi:MAG TPA: 30S ribosome-binding factor RbfA [Candidatus Avimonas sp.]|jgi:ribosome-binding factor A|nr:30S ribosome-binding factor RbfA [Candidatus Avimonas sp.]HQA16177.1 30S ribosome-binding factor RbfA [Candidatus Avimonas sp.]HQD38150.1 30S ribosome-binding factor RbfA [Candidatus Avimonas sp.]